MGYIENVSTHSTETTTRHSFIVYTCTPIYDTPLPLTFFNGKIIYIHCRSGVSCMGFYRKDFPDRKQHIFGNYDLSFSRFPLRIFLFFRISIAQMLKSGRRCSIPSVVPIKIVISSLSKISNIYSWMKFIFNAY